MAPQCFWIKFTEEVVVKDTVPFQLDAEIATKGAELEELKGP